MYDSIHILRKKNKMPKKKQKQSQVIEIPKPILYTAKFFQAVSSSLTTKFAAKLFTTPIRHKLPKRELQMERESVQKSIIVPAINPCLKPLKYFFLDVLRLSITKLSLYIIFS